VTEINRTESACGLHRLHPSGYRLVLFDITFEAKVRVADFNSGRALGVVAQDQGWYGAVDEDGNRHIFYRT
jgi:hypothetical protein